MTLTLAEAGFFQKLFFREAPSTDAVEFVDNFSHFLWWHSVFWFVLLMGLTAYFVVKYRRRPGNMYAEPSPSHNTVIETIWTVVPSLILIVIFLFGFWGYMDKMVSKSDALELQIKGWKWGWGITYPNGTDSLETAYLDEGGRAFPVFYIPENTDITLTMSSQDVIHSFWIPDMRVKMDVMPNRYTGYSFTSPPVPENATAEVLWEDGPLVAHKDMWIFCAEYCGDNHSEMAGIMRVVSQEHYDAWMVAKMSGIGPDVLGPALFTTKCATCHKLDGSQNSTAPSWKGGAEYFDQQYGFGYDVRLNNGEVIERDVDYVRNSILNPSSQVVAGYPGNMPSFDGLLTDTQLEALIWYYRKQSDRSGLDAEPAEGEEGAEDGASEEGAPAESSEEAPADDTAAQP